MLNADVHSGTLKLEGGVIPMRTTADREEGVGKWIFFADFLYGRPLSEESRSVVSYKNHGRLYPLFAKGPHLLSY